MYTELPRNRYTNLTLSITTLGAKGCRDSTMGHGLREYWRYTVDNVHPAVEFTVKAFLEVFNFSVCYDAI